MRIKALREWLEIEEQELTWIMSARSSSPTKADNHQGTLHAPVGYSDKMTWKDKIILAVAKAKQPMLAREIIPVWKSWEPKEMRKDIESILSVPLSKLVRTKRKGQSGALHESPG